MAWSAARSIAGRTTPSTLTTFAIAGRVHRVGWVCDLKWSLGSECFLEVVVFQLLMAEKENNLLHHIRGDTIHASAFAAGGGLKKSHVVGEERVLVLAGLPSLLHLPYIRHANRSGSQYCSSVSVSVSVLAFNFHSMFANAAAAASAPLRRPSGIQREVLALYRQFLRAVQQKPQVQALRRSAQLSQL